jgi:hypothetical protein
MKKNDKPDNKPDKREAKLEPAKVRKAMLRHEKTRQK